MTQYCLLTKVTIKRFSIAQHENLLSTFYYQRLLTFNFF